MCTFTDHAYDLIHLQPAKLASKVNNSTQLLEALNHIKSGIEILKNDLVTRLVTKVPTRWGSEHDCLKRHERLRLVLDDLTSTSRYSLQGFHFTEEDWKQLAGLKNILEVSRIPIFAVV